MTPRSSLRVDFLYFVLFISILIFIHEFGHFAFAKLFGANPIVAIGQPWERFSAAR